MDNIYQFWGWARVGVINWFTLQFFFIIHENGRITGA